MANDIKPGLAHTQYFVGLESTIVMRDQTTICHIDGADEDSHRNAALIAEAFNVLRETGRTPQQLVDEVRELRCPREAQDGLSPTTSSLNDLALDCYVDAERAGWWKTGDGTDVREMGAEFLALWTAAKLALVHTEISEAVEGLRKDLQDTHLPHRKALEVESGDAVIRLLELCYGLGLDIAGAIAEKRQYNRNRADHKAAARAANGGKKF